MGLAKHDGSAWILQMNDLLVLGSEKLKLGRGLRWDREREVWVWELGKGLLSSAREERQDWVFFFRVKVKALLGFKKKTGKTCQPATLTRPDMFTKRVIKGWPVYNPNTFRPNPNPNFTCCVCVGFACNGLNCQPITYIRETPNLKKIIKKKKKKKRKKERKKEERRKKKKRKEKVMKTKAWKQS